MTLVSSESCTSGSSVTWATDCITWATDCISAGPHSTVGSASDSRARGPGLVQVWPDTFVSPFADSRRAVVSYWRN